jgi:hypothetical protein
MFSIGQLVRIKPTMKEGTYDPKGEEIHIYNNGLSYSFVKKMEYYCNKIAIISREETMLQNCYYLEDTNKKDLNNFHIQDYYWHESWLIPIGGEKEELE